MGHVQPGHRQRTPPGPGQGPCVSLGFLWFALFSFVVRRFSFVSAWISESVFLLAVSLDSAVTVALNNLLNDQGVCSSYVFVALCACVAMFSAAGQSFTSLASQVVGRIMLENCFE